MAARPRFPVPKVLPVIPTLDEAEQRADEERVSRALWAVCAALDHLGAAVASAGEDVRAGLEALGSGLHDVADAVRLYDARRGP